MIHETADAVTFVPRTFIDGMTQRILNYYSACNELAELTEHAGVEAEIAEGKPPRDNQRGLSILYDKIIRAGREAQLVLALCQKNIALMPYVTARIRKHVLDRSNQRIHAGAFAQPDFLTRERAAVSDMMFKALEAIGPLMLPETWAE
ncbi:MAG: hypothetical protein KGQ41_05840, partial [Alphaproteobacteria bacterium]|nr:hypothetical protein [Alphaproteobacteria bacterium]